MLKPNELNRNPEVLNAKGKEELELVQKLQQLNLDNEMAVAKYCPEKDDLNLIISDLKKLDAKKIYNFDFRDCDCLDGNGMVSLLKELCRFRIFELDFSESPLGDDGIEHLIKFFRQMTKDNLSFLQNLYLSGTGFTKNGFIAICIFFTNTPANFKILDLQQGLNCDAAMVEALQNLIIQNNILTELLVTNLLMTTEQSDGVVSCLKSNTSIESFWLLDSADIYQQEQIDFITLRNKIQRFKQNAFSKTAQLLNDLSGKAQNDPICLVQNEGGRFDLKLKSQINQEKINVHAGIKKTKMVEIVKGNLALKLRLIDKFIYKVKHYEKYERDFILGAMYQNNLAEFERYLWDTMIVAQLINYIHPNSITLNTIQNWKIISLEYDGENNHLQTEENVLRPFLTLISELEREVVNAGQHFGDDLSDDSDEEDTHKFETKENNENHIQRLRQINAIKSTIENFNHLSYYSSPNDRGMCKKIKDLVEEVTKIKQKGQIPNPVYLVEQIDKIIKGFDAKKIVRAALPATDAQKKQVQHFNALLDKYNNGELTSENFQVVLKDLDKTFVIPQFRGINYLIDRWNQDSRRYHRKSDETMKPMYAESVLKTLPFCFYTQMSINNDPNNPKYVQTLMNEAVVQSDFLQKLNDTGFIVSQMPISQKLTPTVAKKTNAGSTNNYVFNSVADFLQTRFSNGINRHLQGIRRLQKHESKFWMRYSIQELSGSGLPNAYNYAIASGDRPLHALYYALGDKPYYRYPLTPRFYRNGFAEYQHVGKMYASLRPISQCFSRLINRTSIMYKAGFIQLQEGAAGVAPEKESSILVFDAPENIFFQWVVKIPSFKKYSAIYQHKYGLTQELFNLFKQLIEWSYETDQYLIQKNTPKTNKNNVSKAVLELLTEWLTSYWEILLLHISRKEAEKRKLTMVYLNWDGRLSFTPDTGNLHVKGDINIELRNQANFRKELRAAIANQLLANKTKFDKDKCPGFSVVSDKDISTVLLNLKAQFLQKYPNDNQKVDYEKQQTTLLLQKSSFSAKSKKSVDASLAFKEFSEAQKLAHKANVLSAGDNPSDLNLTSDYLLAWQLQIEEFRKNYNSSANKKEDTFHLNVSSGSQMSFSLKATKADGDCFFHAIDKIQTFNREVLVKKLIASSENKEVLETFALEIRQFLYLGCTGGHPNGAENNACQQLLNTGEFRKMIEELRKTEISTRDLQIKIRQELGQANTHGKKPEELLDLLNKRGSNLAPEFSRLLKIVADIDQAILSYCKRKDVFENYVTQYLSQARGFIPFSRDFSGNRIKTTIDIINTLFNMNIQVYMVKSANSSELLTITEQRAGELIPIFHDGIGHFSTLVLDTNKNRVLPLKIVSS